MNIEILSLLTFFIFVTTSIYLLYRLDVNLDMWRNRIAVITICLLTSYSAVCHPVLATVLFLTWLATTTLSTTYIRIEENA
jgi:hypothetical protein